MWNKVRLWNIKAGLLYIAGLLSIFWLNKEFHEEGRLHFFGGWSLLLLSHHIVICCDYFITQYLYLDYLSIMTWRIISLQGPTCKRRGKSWQKWKQKQVEKRISGYKALPWTSASAHQILSICRLKILWDFIREWVNSKVWKVDEKCHRPFIFVQVKKRTL